MQQLKTTKLSPARVVSKMGFATQKNCASINSENSNISKKIPEYAKDFKKEWLYITGINRKCGEFMKKLGDNTDSFEKVFSSSRAKALIRDFKNVLEAQKIGKLQNISELKFKLSVVEQIIELRIHIYLNMGNVFYSDYLLDEDFQDFFENLIIFTNNVNIKDGEYFEDDFYNVEIVSISESESDDNVEIGSISESESESDDF